MSNSKNNDTYCPYNIGVICCPPEARDCTTCGWNPEEDERRRKERRGED